MQTVVAHAQDGRNQIVLLDDETGEMTQLASTIWPEGFGLKESALLAGNLAKFLLPDAPKRNGTNGKKAVPPADQPNLFTESPAPRALPAVNGAIKAAPKAAPKAAAPPKAPNGVDLNARGEPRQKARPKGPRRDWSAVTMDAIATVVKAHPNGITYHQIAQIIFHKEHPEKAELQTIGNRFIAHEGKMRDYGIAAVYRNGMTATGMHKANQKFLVPLPT